MADVLYVSKPVVPPWNDSSKNLVRDLAGHLVRHTPTVLGTRGDPAWAPSRGRVEPLYAPRQGDFAPALRDNLQVLRRLVTGRRADLWHFFFAPNPRTSAAGRMASRLRRVPTVQTVCSAPRPQPNEANLMFADRTVVLSRHTEARLLEAGVPQDRLCRIAPAVEPLPVPSPAARAQVRRELGLPLEEPLVVYPGDLEFGGGAARMLDAFGTNVPATAHLAMACRAKTERARDAERELRDRAHRMGLDARVTWIGETSRILELLGAADVVALPSDDLFAKMDYPLALLEAMSMARPVVVATGAPAEELAEGGCAVEVAPTAEAVAHALGALLWDETRRTQLGEAARTAAIGRFAPAAMAEAYEALYDQLL